MADQVEFVLNAPSTENITVAELFKCFAGLKGIMERSVVPKWTVAKRNHPIFVLASLTLSITALALSIACLYILVDRGFSFFTSVPQSEGGPITPKFQVTGTDPAASIGVTRFTHGIGNSRLWLSKSNAAFVGDFTAVQDRQKLGELIFGGSDGSNIEAFAGVAGYADGTPADGDVPGGLWFQTTPVGGNHMFTRWDIDSSGHFKPSIDSTYDIGTSTLSVRTVYAARVVTPAISVTIANGAILSGGTYHLVDTEGAAASDDLDTIDGGIDGSTLYIRPANSGRMITLKKGTGNIRGANDCVLEEIDDIAHLIFDSILSGWLIVACANNGVLTSMGEMPN